MNLTSLYFNKTAIKFQQMFPEIPRFRVCFWEDSGGIALVPMTVESKSSVLFYYHSVP